MIAALAFVRAHWQIFAVAAVFGSGVAAGRYSRPPAPAVHEVLDAHAKVDEAQKLDEHKVEGPETITKTVEEFEVNPPRGLPSQNGSAVMVLTGPDSPRNVPAATVLVKRTVTVTQRGPEVVDIHRAAEQHLVTDQHLDLTITPPAPRPGWAVEVGLEDALGARALRLEVRRHLLGPFWVGLSATPARRSIGIAAAVEW